MAVRLSPKSILVVASALLLLTALDSAPANAGPDALERAQELRVTDPQAALLLLDRHILEPDALDDRDDEDDHLRDQASLLELRARIHRDNGRREEAAADAVRFERIAEALDEPVPLARAQFLRGTIQAERGDIAGALQRFHAARRTLEETDATVELARVTNALGVAHNFTDDYARARDYYEQALQLVRRTGEAGLEGTILGNLALVIGELEGAEAGLAAHREALALARERDDTEAAANQLANICSRLVAIGHLDQAATTCREALARVETLNNARLIAGTRMSLGDLDYARGNLEAARHNYEAALSLAEDRVPSVEVEVLDKLADLDATRGAPQQALQRLRQLMDLRAELLERERASLIEELEVRYGVEQQEREIELLELDRELQAAKLRQRNLMLIGAGIALLLVTLLLLVAWRGFSAKSQLERELAERNDELGEALTTITRLAREDALTGLLNRRGFGELAEHELRRTSRTGEPLALVMADLDDFKQLNDRHGHAVGDEILRGLARRMERAVRELDIVCRWGGEEFVFLLPRTDQADARQVIERVRESIASGPITTEAGPFAVRMTFGITRVAGDIDKAIERADQSMYLGKQAGGDRIVASGDDPPGR